MFRILLFIACFFLLLLFFESSAYSQDKNNLRIKIKIVTDEADAVLDILTKKESKQEVNETDWQRVFSSEGYTRLKKREISMNRRFEDEEFRAFVLSDKLLSRRRLLVEALAKWKETNVERVAELPLAYLPPAAHIQAKIYPVIKPRENSFVFDIPNDPAIFLYLDPTITKEKFENTLAHELHHIGYGTACPTKKVSSAIKKLPENSQRVLKWIGAFGEGFAMLAAAGGPDIHPHALSPSEDRIRWDKDVANFNNDLRTVEKFLVDLMDGKLSEERENEIARSFYGIQGPWYTVGWKMAVVIEKTYGRQKLIECMCDQRKLLPRFNNAVKKYNREHNERLAVWSGALIKKLK
jgi:hypothetical protein